MKTRFRKHTRLVLLAVLAALCVGAPAARAGYEREHRNGSYWGRFSPGMAIGELPKGYVQVAVGPIGYCG